MKLPNHSLFLPFFAILFSFSVAQAQQAAAPTAITPQTMPQAIEAIGKGQIQQLLQQIPGAESAASRSVGLQTPGIESAATSQQPEATLNQQETAAGVDIHLAERTFSTMEGLYRRNYGSDLAADLSQFGYAIFGAGTTAPSQLAVPDASYILGPGDKLRLRVWGTDVDAEYTGAIDRSGSINVPKIGIVPLAGARFGDAEGIIRHEAEKYVQGINISVSLAELRSHEIYVVGEVARPGLQMVPPFSTILGGLVHAGGVLKTGTLRGIQLIRDGQIIATLDLYELLLRGDKSADLLLTDRDTIFVPRLGETAAITGAVVKPAIYERKSEQSVQDLIDLAGGLLPQAFNGRVYLRRFAANQSFIVKDMDTGKSADVLASTSIQNGDLIETQFLAAAWPQTVSVNGHVWFPDVFSWHPGMKLSEILRGPEMLKPEAITDFAHLYRFDPKTTRYQLQSIPLDKIFAGSFDSEVQPHDRIEILSREELKISEPIRIQGAVWKAGEFAFRPGMTLGALLSLAGGLRFGADTTRIDISRQIIENERLLTRHILVDAKMNENLALEPYDYVFVRQVREATSFKEITIQGEVLFPGTYRIKDGERLADVIERAGGFTEDAYYYGCQYFSEEAQRVQQRSLDQLVDDLQVRAETMLADQTQAAGSASDAQVLATGQSALRRLIEKLRQVKANGRVAIQMSDLASLKTSPQNITVGHGDRILIPKRPEFISVVGSVYSPNSFLYQPQTTLAAYLDKAGGPTRSAAEKYMYVLKANGEVTAKVQDGLFGDKFADLTLMPGDTVVVPEKLDRIPYLMVSRDIADILFKIATTAGVALAL